MITAEERKLTAYRTPFPKQNEQAEGLESRMVAIVENHGFSWVYMEGEQTLMLWKGESQRVVRILTWIEG